MAVFLAFSSRSFCASCRRLCNSLQILQWVTENSYYTTWEWKIKLSVTIVNHVNCTAIQQCRHTLHTHCDISNIHAYM